MGDPKRRPGNGQRPDLASLRARVREIERGAATEAGVPRFPLGLEELDGHLGGGLALGRMHEITGETRSELRDAAPFGFTAALLVRLLRARAGRGGDILWCIRDANMFGGVPSGWGLKRLGLDPDRILWVEARDEAERLWAMEEGLRCRGLAAVVGELAPPRMDAAGRVAERRLQLAAEAGGVTGFLLRSGGGAGASVAESRLHVVSAPAGADPRPHWSLSLERLRGGRPGSWQLLWDSSKGRFASAGQAARPVPETARKRLVSQSRSVAA